jgi:hypothetical protein
VNSDEEALHQLETLAHDATYLSEVLQGRNDDTGAIPSLVERLVPRAQLVASLIKDQAALADAVAEDEKRQAQEDRPARKGAPARGGAGDVGGGGRVSAGAVRSGGIARSWPRHQHLPLHEDSLDDVLARYAATPGNLDAPLTLPPHRVISEGVPLDDGGPLTRPGAAPTPPPK